MQKDGITPAKLALLIVTNLADDKRGQLVIPAIPLRGLEAAGELSGRMFVFTKGKSLGTAKANMWEVAEINYHVWGEGFDSLAPSF